jgi:hypothetical protein
LTNLTRDDIRVLYQSTRLPERLSKWSITRPELLEALYQASLSTTEPEARWPRADLPVRTRTRVVDDQLIYMLNLLESGRKRRRVWREADIPRGDERPGDGGRR